MHYVHQVSSYLPPSGGVGVPKSKIIQGLSLELEAAGADKDILPNFCIPYTLPIEKIITLKNAQAWVSMVFT